MAEYALPGTRLTAGPETHHGSPLAEVGQGVTTDESPENLTVADQERLAETLQRATETVSPRALIAALVSGIAFIVACVALWIVFPPAHLDAVAGVSGMVVMTLALLVRFETPRGFTSGAQLAFVPLMFVLPPALLAPGVSIALALSWMPLIVKGELRPSRLLRVPENTWFAVGPAWTLALLHANHATAWVVLAALGSQFVVDFTVSSASFGFALGVSLRESLADAWVYGADFAMSGVGLAVAAVCASSDFAPLLVAPLLGLLTFFAQDRSRRFAHLIELNETYRGTALLLGDVIGADDAYTGSHCQDVVELAVGVGEELGLNADQRRNLEFAALLHDVGKIAIPKEIINKPGKLTAEEWAVMKTHCAEGEKMLTRIGGFMNDVGRIVRSHHERWDGKGYPDGLSAEQAPVEARIITACDSWNAMRTTRSYRAAMSVQEAVAEIERNKGTQFDPVVAEALLRVVHDDEELV